MMATKYQRGAALERRCIKRLEREGWRCVRSAGSHGPFDVVAYHHLAWLCIQVKGGGWPGLIEMETLQGEPVPHSNTRIEVWRYDKGKRNPRIKRWYPSAGAWEEVTV